MHPLWLTRLIEEKNRLRQKQSELISSIGQERGGHPTYAFIEKDLMTREVSILEDYIKTLSLRITVYEEHLQAFLGRVA